MLLNNNFEPATVTKKEQHNNVGIGFHQNLVTFCFRLIWQGCCARASLWIRQTTQGTSFQNTPVFKARTIFIQILGHIWTQPTLLAPATFGTILGKNFANFRGIYYSIKVSVRVNR